MAGQVVGRQVVGLADNAAGAVDNIVAAAGNDLVRANPFALPPLVFEDISVAATRVDEVTSRLEAMIAQYGNGTLDEAQQAATKDVRIGVHRINLEAQARLEPHFDEALDAAVTSKLRQTDATLEDLGWQLARKPSPDGRFNGIDLPGALRDGQSATSILGELAPLQAADDAAPAVAAFAA